MNHFNFSESWGLILASFAAVAAVFFFVAGLIHFGIYIRDAIRKRVKP